MAIQMASPGVYGRPCIERLDDIRLEVRHRILDHRLTPRQRQILAEMTDGSSFREVGGRLGISEPTARKIAAAAYQRLEVGGLVEAFLALGWLHRPAGGGARQV
jgi:DNA-binding CsgD family transcriptional regulator